MTHSHTVRVPLPVERALHLFTPVGERAWAPGWDPVFPAGESGDGAAPGTVFLTGASTWVVVDRAPDRVRYARVTPGVRAGTVEVRLRADEVRPSLPRDEVLAMAPASEDGRFRVPRILDAP